MSDCCVKFNVPASRQTINHLVVEYLKYILYYRGQFPLPLDQLKRSLEVYNKSDSFKIGNHFIYSDKENQCTSTRPKLNNRTKQVYVDSINKFVDFFNQLLLILQSEEVLEVVMNLGPNMMNPKELHRITLPKNCSDSHSSNDTTSMQRYRLEFFKTLLHSSVLQDLGPDNLIPISILLRLKNSVSLKDYMEQKRFYVPPQKCKQVLVQFDNPCTHCGVETTLGCLQDLTLKENAVESENHDRDLWVKLKPDLKGFKNFVESK